jgi:sugar phosphate isomerase/epimerase
VKEQQSIAVAIAPLGPVRETIEWVGSLGVRGVQLSLPHVAGRERMGHSARRDLRATLRRLELQCAGLDAPVPPADWLLGDRVDRVVDAFDRALELAESLDRAAVTLATPSPSSDAAAEARRQEVLAVVVARAATRGVALADLSASTRPLQRPLGACIDPAAAIAAGGHLHEVIARCAGSIAGARVCDLLRTGLRGPIGEPEGQVRVSEYRASLEVAGFRGLPVVDPVQWPQPREGVLRCLAAWQAAQPGVL